MKKNKKEYLCSVKLGENVYIGNNTVLGQPSIDTIKTKRKPRRIYIGSNSIIQSGSILFEGVKISNDSLIGANVVIREDVQIGNHVRIGSLCGIEKGAIIKDYVTIATQSHITVRAIIEEYSFIGAQVVTMNIKRPLHMAKKEYQIEEPPIFKKGCIVGSNATILPGVIIGEESVVGAGSIVVKNVPPRTIIMGQPAKIKGKIPNIFLLANRMKEK